MNRLENTRVGFVARYWRAAAYQNHNDRPAEKWAKIALAPLLIMLPLTLLNAAAYWIVDTYPAYFPEDGTIMWHVLDAFPAGFEALSAVLVGLSVMYLGKLVARVADMEFWEEASR